jgi:hypothetical protein
VQLTEPGRKVEQGDALALQLKKNCSITTKMYKNKARQRF